LEDIKPTTGSEEAALLSLLMQYNGRISRGVNNSSALIGFVARHIFDGNINHRGGNGGREGDSYNRAEDVIRYLAAHGVIRAFQDQHQRPVMIMAVLEEEVIETYPGEAKESASASQLLIWASKTLVENAKKLRNAEEQAARGTDDEAWEYMMEQIGQAEAARDEAIRRAENAESRIAEINDQVSKLESQLAAKKEELARQNTELRILERDNSRLAQSESRQSRHIETLTTQLDKTKADGAADHRAIETIRQLYSIPPEIGTNQLVNILGSAVAEIQHQTSNEMFAEIESIIDIVGIESGKPDIEDIRKMLLEYFSGDLSETLQSKFKEINAQIDIINSIPKKAARKQRTAREKMSALGNEFYLLLRAAIEK
jgi:hypothetical protein